MIVFFRCVVVVVLFVACHVGWAQTRVDFHLLPAVSTGPLDPDWSPDGSSLVYAARGDIWILPIEGGVAVALTEGPAYHSEPAFSPDGQQVAMTMDFKGNLELGLIDVASGDVRRLTDHSELDFAADWSADGEALYFVSRRFGSLDILRLTLASGEITKVVAGPRNEFQPAVSPDGRYLAYVGPVANRSGSGGLWVLPLPEGEARLVHYEETSYRPKPQWSSDGKTLTYVSDAAGSMDLAIVPVSGGNPVRLTYEPDGEFDPAVSPDGTQLAFVTNQTGPTELFIAPAAGAGRNSWRPVAAERREALFETGRVRGRILGPDDRVTPARLMISASDGRSYTEERGFHRMVPATRTHYQHSSGEFDIEVPVGPVTLQAMRGFEFLPASSEVVVERGEVVELDLQLQRIAEPRGAGWYVGDTHVHDRHEGRFGITREGFVQQLIADDVGFANALIHMDGTKIMGRWSDLSGKPSPLSTETTILQYAQEYRGAFGHIGLLGLSEFVMPMIGGAANTPFAPDDLGIGHIDKVHSQGGIAGFMHPYNHSISGAADTATSAIPVIAALGKADFYDVASIASLEAESTSVYYKLLNSGIRLAATGGTDNFSDVWFDPSGGTTRTYARAEGDSAPGVPEWLDAVSEGRTFATSGPLLFLRVNGKQPGDEIPLAAGESASFGVQVSVSSIASLDAVEILVNGEVAERSIPADSSARWEFRTSVQLPAGGWIAARATGPASPYVGDAFAFAQTSPVYIRHADGPFTDPADARYLLQSVEELWRRVDERDAWHNDAQKEAYRGYVDEARRYYRNVVLQHPADQAMNEEAPETFRVQLRTTKGDILLQLQRAWAPLGVDRFYNLVRNGYYDDSRFFRIRDKDFAQFGINGEPRVAQAWRDQRIADDPVVESNRRGTVAFAMGTEPNDRTTQVYINLKDKPELDALGFAVMGEVISGMDVADALYSGYGETAAGGIRGGKQDAAFAGGNDFFSANFPQLDSIIEASIVHAP